MKYFVTSDTHFGHANILQYCNRQFKDVEEMNKTIIDRWNERVSNEDTVFFLGDFCFKRSSEAPTGNVFEYYRNKLKGNIIFVRGNHDDNNGTKSKLEGALIKHGKLYMYLCHKPINAMGKFNLVGHIHNKARTWKFKDMYFVNCCVEMWNYYPINLDTIIGKYYNQSKFNEKLFPEYQENLDDR